MHYAGELEKSGLQNFLAQLALGASDMVAGKYGAADETLSNGRNGPLAQLSIGIARAWALYGNGKIDEALETIDQLSGPDWFEVFKATHKTHLLFAAGRNPEALEAAEGAYAIGPGRHPGSSTPMRAFWPPTAGRRTRWRFSTFTTNSSAAIRSWTRPAPPSPPATSFPRWSPIRRKACPKFSMVWAP